MGRMQISILKEPVSPFSLCPEGGRKQIDPEQWQVVGKVCLVNVQPEALWEWDGKNQEAR